VRYTYFLKKADYADELGRLDKVKCSLAKKKSLLRSSLIYKLVDEFGHARPFLDSKCHHGRMDI
jgi:hypothetical protein